MSKLVEQFPEQFQDDKHFLGIWIDAGWELIVEDACREIQAALTAEELRIFKWVQVKEKFGELRMYSSHRAVIPVSIVGADGVALSAGVGERTIELPTATSDLIRAIIARSKERAAHTCEICGAPGELRGKGRVKTVCEHHAREGRYA